MSHHPIASDDDANARAHDQSRILWAVNAPAPNTYTGTNGDDNFLGTEGADTFIGLKGDDVYRIDNLDDRIIEEASSGYDTVIAAIDYKLPSQLSIEVLRVARSSQWQNVNLTGNELAQTLEGKSGNNILDGGGGADILKGFAGDDTYVVDTQADLVFEAVWQGSDTVIASCSFALGKGQEIETLRLAMVTRNGSFNLVGNEFAQTLVGNDFANTLNGGGGADLMIGGRGNDNYIVDDSGDRVVEAVGGGIDIVTSTKSLKLLADQEIETVRLASSTNTQNLDLYGNQFDQSLQGNGGKNLLDGKGGADLLFGYGGNDTYVVDHARDKVYENPGNGSDTVIARVSWRLDARQEVETIRVVNSPSNKGISLTGNDYSQTMIGGGGADVLDGGFGSDILIGGAGADTFVFGNSLSARNVDRITDFSDQDSIRLAKTFFPALELGQLDGYAFKNISTGTVDKNDRILYKQSTGELFYDADGSSSGAAVKFFVIDNKATLTAADFFVV